MDINEQIRQLHKHGGHSQKAIARILGVSRNTVKKYYEGALVSWERQGVSGRQRYVISNVSSNNYHHSVCRTEIKGAYKMQKQVLTPFARLKRRVLRELPKKKLIGDIVISAKEYSLLMEYLKNVYSAISRGSSIESVDPVLAVTLVQVGVTHYNANYWSHLAKEVGLHSIPLNHRGTFATCFIDTLRAYEKAIVGVNQFVKNVLLHGFVSDYFADDLFNFLFAFYRLDLERDITRLNAEMMSSLMSVMVRDDNTGRTYMLVKQTAEAIVANPIGSKIRIRRLLRLVDRRFWEGIVPADSVNRLSRRFVKWQDSSTEFKIEYSKYHGGSNTGSRSRNFSSPYLECDIAKNCFRLILPAQLIKFEQDRDVYWRVSCGGNTQCINTNLYQGVTGNKTGDTFVDIDAQFLFQEIETELMSGQVRL